MFGTPLKSYKCEVRILPFGVWKALSMPGVLQVISVCYALLIQLSSHPQ